MSRQVFAIGDTGLELVNGLNANFLQLYNNSAINAKDYGFLPTASASDNVTALQAALLGGNKSIFINTGTYELDDTILIDSNTSIVCEQGVVFKKTADYCQILLNRGALTKAVNENILIDGLTISPDGHGESSTLVYGLHAQLGFYYVKNLTIKNFTCLDGVIPYYTIYCVQWENLYFENCKITSVKDGIKLGTGHDALFNNCIFETEDDSIPLCTSDLWSYTVEIGSIYNVTYRNIVGRKIPGGATSGTGYMARMMVSSWADYANGNTYITGDICLNAGHLYQCTNTSVFSAVGANAPVHHTGIVTGADGIKWRYVNDSTVYHADIYNILFDNIKLINGRNLMYANLYIDGVNMMCGYPGTEDLPKIYNIRVVNSVFDYVSDSGSSVIIKNDGVLKDIIFIGCIFDYPYIIHLDENDAINFTTDKPLNITMVGNLFRDFVLDQMFHTEIAKHKLTIRTSGNIYESDGSMFGFTLSSGATLRWIGDDLPLIAGNRETLTPVIADVVRDHDGLWIYKAAGWVNLAV